MRRKISCPCDNVFEVEVKEEINLDTEKEFLDQIIDGTFLNFECSVCGKKHKPEFPITIEWPSKKIKFEVLPELERGDFYRRKKNPEGIETVIGYPELADRISALRDGLEPAALEAIKYYVLLKAQESYPEEEISMWYQSKNADSLEFHIHGIRKDEVAVSRIPLALYEKTLEDYKKHPRSELFSALRVRTYMSIQNTMRPEALL